MTDLRVVLDTNVLVSGLLIQPSVPQQVFDFAISHTVVLSSQAILAEIERILIKPKFDRYISLEKRLKFIASFAARSEYIEITEQLEMCRDAKDNHLLELAVCGTATHLVTGDQDLLVLNPFRTVEILQPSSFLARFV